MVVLACGDVRYICSNGAIVTSDRLCKLWNDISTTWQSACTYHFFIILIIDQWYWQSSSWCMCYMCALAWVEYVWMLADSGCTTATP